MLSRGKAKLHVSSQLHAHFSLRHGKYTHTRAGPMSLVYINAFILHGTGDLEMVILQDLVVIEIRWDYSRTLCDFILLKQQFTYLCWKY